MAASKYQQIATTLGEMVDGMAVGDRIPSEVELSQRFGASRMTVRRALQILIDSGRLEGRPGSGTFVRAPRVDRALSSMSFTETMRGEGKSVSSQIISATLAPGSPEALAELELPDGAMVFEIRRVRCADDVPVCVERALLPADRFPGLLGEDLTGSLYTILSRGYSTEVHWTAYRVRAVLPEDDVRARLRIADRVPCLETRTVSRDRDEIPIESTISLYRGDLYSLSFRP